MSSNIAVAVPLPHTSALIGTFPYKQPNASTAKLVQQELMDVLNISADIADKLLFIHLHRRNTLIDAINMFYNTLNQEPECCYFSVSGNDAGQPILTITSLISDVRDIELAVSIEYLGQATSVKEIPSVYNFNELIKDSPKIEILAINPKAKDLFKPNVLDIINTYFEEIQKTIPKAVILTRSVGDGICISKTYQQILSSGNDVFNFSVRVDMNPDIVTLDKPHLFKAFQYN